MSRARVRHTDGRARRFKNYVDLVRIYASRENSALLPLVTRLNNIDGGA
jgi:hypothetical protein